MSIQVLEVAATRELAEVHLHDYAAAIRSIDEAENLRVKVREMCGAWQIVLVDRRPTR